jgi:hypothetical protein
VLLSALVGTAALTLLPVTAFGQNQNDLCEVVQSPLAYNGEIVTLRAPVQIAFEKFMLSSSDCSERKIDDVRLEYGKGPRRQPVTWCCGDMVPRDPLVFVQDKDFHRFHRSISAQEHAKYLYQVTATLTGRFDSIDTKPCPGDAKSRCCVTAGFGHLGLACGRLVIRAVLDASANPR